MIDEHRFERLVLDWVEAYGLGDDDAMPRCFRDSIAALRDRLAMPEPAAQEVAAAPIAPVVSDVAAEPDGVAMPEPAPRRGNRRPNAEEIAIRKRIAEILRANPARSNCSIAREVGASDNTVRLQRLAMGIPPLSIGGRVLQEIGDPPPDAEAVSDAPAREQDATVAPAGEEPEAQTARERRATALRDAEERVRAAIAAAGPEGVITTDALLVIASETGVPPDVVARMERDCRPLSDVPARRQFRRNMTPEHREKLAANARANLADPEFQEKRAADAVIAGAQG